MNKIWQSFLILLLMVSFTTVCPVFDQNAYAKKKKSRFVTIQNTAGDDEGNVSPSIRLKERDVVGTFVRDLDNVAIVPVQLRLTGIPVNFKTRDYMNAVIYDVGIDEFGDEVERWEGKVSLPKPIRNADKGKNGPAPRRVSFTIPVNFDEQIERKNLYIVDASGARFKFELPEMTSRRVVEPISTVTSSVELPPTVEGLSDEEQELFKKFRKGIWRDPNFMIRVSRRPGVFQNARNPDGFFLDVPNRKRVIRNFRKGRVIVNETNNNNNGGGVASGGTILGIGNPLQRAAFDSTEEGNGYITVVSPGGDPNNVGDTAGITTNSDGSTNAQIVAQNLSTDVYFSRRTDSPGQWIHILISGGDGTDGTNGADGAPGAAAVPPPPPPPAPPPTPACSDGNDNDGDGLTDFGADPGCSDPNDNDEFNPAPNACSDGIDNDGDGLIDFGVGAGFDPGCASASSNRENPQCDDNLDEDGNGRTRFDPDLSVGDPGCFAAHDNNERAEACRNLIDDDADNLSDANDPGCLNQAGFYDPLDNDESNVTLTQEFLTLPPAVAPPGVGPGAYVSAAINVDFLVTTISINKIIVSDNTVPFQQLQINLDGAGNIASFTYLGVPGAPNFPATNASVAAPNITNMAIAFYKDTANNVIVFRARDEGFGSYTHNLNLNYSI